MLQKLKLFLPWVLCVGLLVALIVQRKNMEARIKMNESIIDSIRYEIKSEESVIDSFSVVRDSIREERDSSLHAIDTLCLPGLKDILFKNIKWYEENY